MIRFRIDDMTCNHCVGAVTQAVKAADPQARVEIDLSSHRVTIESPGADAEQLSAAIRDAGYTPVPA